MSQLTLIIMPFLKRQMWWCDVAVFSIILWLLIPQHVVAQFTPKPDDKPFWMSSLTCDPAYQTYQGLAYCTGLSGRAHVLVVDLFDTSGLRFEYIIAEGADRNGSVGPCRDVNLPAWSTGPGCFDTATGTYPIMSLTQAAARVPAVAAVFDTDYGAKSGGDRGHGPEGLTIVSGNRYDGPSLGDTDNNAVNRPWLALGKSAPFQAHIGQLSTDNGEKPFDWIETGVGGAPWLIRNGELDNDQIKGCIGADVWSCQSSEAQAAAGLSRGGRWLYIVVASGIDAAGIANFMKDNLSPWSAIKFDGGGSTQMWYRGLPQADFPEHIAFAQSNRNLSQYMAVIAKSGNGIQLDSPSLAALAIDSTTTIIIDEGDTAELDPTFRNEGTLTWTATKNFSLVEKPAVNSPFGEPELIPLPHDVAPGGSVAWSFPAPTSGIHTYRFQMAQDDIYFGEEQQFLVIVVPEALQNRREDLEAFIDDLYGQGQQEVEEIAQAIEQWVITEGQKIAENLLRRVGQMLADLLGQLARALEAELMSFCNSVVLVPVALVAVWLRRQRKG